MSHPASAAGRVDLTRSAVDAFLMAEPRLHGLSRQLGQVERWAYDHDRPGHSGAGKRQETLARHSYVLSGLIGRIPPCIELAEYLCALKTDQRLVFLTEYDIRVEDGVSRLVEFISENVDDGSCDHLLHWFEVMEREDTVSRCFTVEAAHRIAVAVGSAKP